MRAMNMLGKAEEQYHDLMRKKTIVENDKAKIYKVIEELDVKKRAEIRTAWDKVNFFGDWDEGRGQLIKLFNLTRNVRKTDWI